MSKKAAIWLGISVVLVILIAWVGMTVSAVSGESSKADAFLKDAVANHMPQAEVSQNLKDMGFEMTDTPGSSTGNGPTHSLLVYSTHLVVNLTYDAEGKAHSYHLDKS
jgi:hypothetical protein